MPTKPRSGSPIRRTHPLAVRCAGFWAFNEGQGNRVVNLITPGNGDGVASGSTPPIWKLDALTNELGMYFAGGAASVSYLDCGITPQLANLAFDATSVTAGNTDFTLAARFRFDNFGGTGGLAERNDGNSVGGWLIGWDTGDKLGLTNEAGSNYKSEMTSSFTPTTAVFHDIVLIYRTGSTIVLYIDGVPAACTTPNAGSGSMGTIVTDYPNHFYIGRIGFGMAGAQSWKGIISMMGVWRRPLTYEDAKLLHQDPWVLVTKSPCLAHMLPLGATPLTVSVSDSITLTDAITVQASNTSQSVVISEGIALTDAISLIRGIGIAQNDSLSLSDLITSNKFAAAAVSDFLLFTDSIAKFVTFAMTFSDSISLSDLISVLVSSTQPIEVSIADYMPLVDVISVALDIVYLKHELSDTLTFSDDVQIQLPPRSLVVHDNLNFTDSIRVNLKESFNTYLRRYLNDVIAPSIQPESYSFQGEETPEFEFPTQSQVSVPLDISFNPVPPPEPVVAIEIGVSDSMELTDTFGEGLNITEILISDFLGLYDSINVQMNTNTLTLTDALNFVDTVQFKLGGDDISLAVSDTLALADSLKYAPGFIFVDIIELQDTIRLALSYTELHISDSLNLSDSATIDRSDKYITVSDSINLLDTIQITGPTMSVQFIVNERPTLVGAAATLAHVPISNSEAVYVNGLRLRKPEEYTISSNVITLIVTSTGDYIEVDYQYNV